MSGSPRKPPGEAKGHRSRNVIELVPPPPESEVPAPPKGLAREALARWDAFWSSPVAATVDLDADGHKLTRWIVYVDEWDRAMRASRKERLVTGSQGQPVLNPLLRYVQQLEAAIKAIEAEFGMGAKSRSDLGISMGQAALTAADLNRLAEEADGADEEGALAGDIEGQLLEEYEAG